MMIFPGRRPEWTEQDALLATAYTMLEDETCKNCGVVGWLAYGVDSNVQFRVEHSQCYSCLALERHKEENKSKRKQPGAIPYVVPVLVTDDGQDFPSRHEAYLRMSKG